MVVLELVRAGQQQRPPKNRFKTSKKWLLKGAGNSKWWFWNWSGQGQGRGSSRAAAEAGVPKPPKNRFKTTKKSLFKGAGNSKWWFWNWSGQGQGRSSSRAAARAAAGAGFEMYTRLSAGKYISYSTCSAKKVPRPWNSNVVFLT